MRGVSNLLAAVDRNTAPRSLPRMAACRVRLRKGRKITGEQCRAARERLDWTRFELATATDVPRWFIAAFEDGKAMPDFLAGYEVDLRATLESAGMREVGEG
jgi:DNA-binding XRE family transcriptional regulator